MTHDQIEALVVRLEKFATREPQAYKTRVFLLALLGYGYFALVVAALLAICSGLALLAVNRHLRGTYFVGKLIFPVLGLVYLILRSLWFRIPAPDGLRLNRSDSPRLFHAVDHLQRALNVPKIHEVLLTQDFNAAIAQVPRLGAFGFHKNYLILGLPLMMALSLDHFRAVLAHEFGHLSGAHGRFGSWIYRVRRSWYQLMANLEHQQHWGSFIFDRFIKWYAPYFGSYSWVLARAQEYEADRCAANIAGSRTAAEALVRVEVLGRFLEQRFFKNLYGRVEAELEPQVNPYSEMQQAFRTSFDPSQSGQWLQEGLKTRTGSDDTHPSLSDRLAALAEQPHVDWNLTTTAAEALLGEGLPSYIARLDSEWKENIAASWRERHRNVQEIRSKLAEMESTAAVQPLTVEQAWQRATWTEEVDTAEKAVPLYQEVLGLNPNHAAAQFALGRLQLFQGQMEGIHWIERAMSRDAEFRYSGCGLIASFLQQQGKEQEAKQYLRKATEQGEALEVAHKERSRLSPKDSFASHGLTSEQLEPLREQLAHFPDVAEAYLVRRIVEHFPEKPLYVLGVVANVKWYRFRWETADTKLVKSLMEKVVLPGEGFFVAFNSGTKKIAKKAKRIAGSRFYRRSDS